MKRFLIYILIAALGTLIVAAEPKSAAAQKGVQVLTRGPVHEAFAETVTFDPEPGLVAPKRRRPPSKNCRRTRSPKEPTSRGSPATGHGTRSEAISFGSAASGATFRRDASGCPVIGVRPRKASSGLPDIGPTPR